MGVETTSVAVSKEAEAKLDGMLRVVNEGWKAGKVTKVSLVTWMIEEFSREFGTELVEKIRSDHFDEVAFLEGVIEEAREARKAGVKDEHFVSSRLSTLTSFARHSQASTSAAVSQKRRGRPKKVVAPVISLPEAPEA